ncbi:hypothetical protein QSV34_15045 [Porticoccus sp. W117]|uniref:DUF7660 family protein n=1 Tax=Porticoccus sp. W117 TaxID=3054777 RepID=UPI0025951F22|nr:hypothetical protein [Porticoccus sp. W117]MDM3872667.1 hypothetical protein [Porticoccus sp. W117]
MIDFEKIEKIKSSSDLSGFIEEMFQLIYSIEKKEDLVLVYEYFLDNYEYFSTEIEDSNIASYWDSIVGFVEDFDGYFELNEVPKNKVSTWTTLGVVMMASAMRE